MEDGREDGVELEGLEARENLFIVKGPGGPLEEDIAVLGACSGGVACGGPLSAGIEARLTVESVCLRMDECDGAGRDEVDDGCGCGWPRVNFVNVAFQVQGVCPV